MILELKKDDDRISEWVCEKMKDCLSFAKDRLTQMNSSSALLIREDAENKDWPGYIRSKADLLLGSWTANDCAR